MKAKKMSEQRVKSAIIMWLLKNDWKLDSFGDQYEKGVDIKAKRNKSSQYFLIETKGSGKTSGADYVYFLTALGQILIRMDKIGNATRYKFGIGLPDAITKKEAFRKLPWQVAKKLKLYILSVDNNKNVTEYSYKDLKEHQLGKSNLTVKKSA